MTRRQGPPAAPDPRWPARLAALWLLTLLLTLPARAEIIRPWSPPGSDSLKVWAEEARVRFQSNLGDSVGGDNFRAYDLVGRIGRRMVWALGRGHLAQANAIEGIIDSLGLSAEVCVDPRMPDFVLLMAHNPFRSAAAVGFLFWYKGDDLRTQGIAFDGGWRPAFRVWWSGHAEYPYECGIVDHARDGKGALSLLLLRLSADGTYWVVQQFPGNGPVLGKEGEVAWVDVNGDGAPELVAWARAPSDSMFLECSGCPTLHDERTFVERADGFELNDSRLMPSPYASFQLFVRLLHQQNRAAAARLLADPKKVEEAIALGWGADRKPGAWRMEWAEAAPWPRWLMLRHEAGKGRPLYAVHFAMHEGRWIISDWGREPTPPPPPATPSGTEPSGAPADTVRARIGAGAGAGSR
jgi:hypothetical protein